ncbi:periodic tryptophan protein 2 homolog [Vespa mandarinia]|uniref:periodic tryptophan protein 2 homolog n=1 Tax=Vespa mandarinia TaxID=7446 RepID=UPI00160F05AA|nr:periodic tryptophan protein 2 homolog [Vespa mandarinia]XP_035733872.1 periodic tryptophan protein 2 homolog [Vespa mandarinia]
MKFAYKFSNILGTVYRKGDLIFSPDGSSVISPVGNKISIFDLKNNKSLTLPIESKYNYTAIDISPDGYLLIAINEVGDAHIISMISKMIIHKYRFKRRIRSVKFSPDGKHFAVCKENNVFIFNAPGLQSGEYNPFIMERIFHGAVDETTFIDWSFDSKLLAIGSKDATTKLYSLQKWENFKFITLGCHTDMIIACFFEKNSYDISTISRNGQLCVWECTIDPDDLVEWEPPTKKDRKTDSDDEDDIDLDKAIEKTDKQRNNLERKLVQLQLTSEQNEEENTEMDSKVKKLRYKKIARHYLINEIRKQTKDAVLTAATYHRDTHILVVGFNNGSFCLYEMPEVNMIHSLNISAQGISSIALNSTGDWIALGCSHMGQLLVWEWQSETYAMKQQGHSNNINCLAYSPDGQYIVTGGDDGKVKLWNTMSGFCSVTFQEHSSAISGVLFSHNRRFIVSSSLDGTVRAYDLTRYRNFKTLTSPRPVQFSCVAIDSSDEFVVAGGQDFFYIYLWSIKLGTLLEILGGHEGPVVSLAFNPSPASTELVSVSWDKTLKIWNAIENGSMHETIQLTADGLYVTYKPDGEEVAVSTLDGQISFFHCKTAMQTGSIEGRNDLGSGRSEIDMITAKKTLQAKAFTSLCYSADGSCILAGGQSKNVCIYNVKEAILLKKFEVTQNRSLDAVDDFINRRKMTEFGNIALVEEREENEGGNVTLRLPGVKSGDMASRSMKPEVRVFSLQFSPTGQAWAAATTEGLLIYSLDVDFIFDPFQLDLKITPDTIKETLAKVEYTQALMMALKLNEKSLIRQVIETIPYTNIELIVRNLADIYLEKTLKFIAVELESAKHIHFYLLWIEVILNNHGHKMNTTFQIPLLLMLQKNMQRKYDDLSSICDFNQYTISYIKKMGEIKAAKSKLNDSVATINGSSDTSFIMEMDTD